MIENSTYTGSKFKALLEIDGELNLDDDNWFGYVHNGNRKMAVSKTKNTKRHDDGSWYVLVDTAILGSGRYELVIEGDIIDTDFDGSVRHETYRTELIPVYPKHKRL